MRYFELVEQKSSHGKRWLLCVLLVLSGCSSSQRTLGGTPDRQTFVIASTTSTQDSGILDAMVPAFEKDFPKYSAKVVAVGSGESIQLGISGDADVLLVHSPRDEEEFMRTGKGLYRRGVMGNRFAIAGPRSDPAGVRHSSSPEEALMKIATSSSTFISRGDGSGTHKKELELWRSIALEPTGNWYLESGQGMGETITIAAEKSAYLLTDTATFRVFGSDNLEALFRGEDKLKNPYSVIPIKSSRNAEGGKAFADWLTGPRGQKLISDFGRKTYGEPLFTPAGH